MVEVVPLVLLTENQGVSVLGKNQKLTPPQIDKDKARAKTVSELVQK